MPQSTANLVFPASTIKQEPVTVLAAPRNVIFIRYVLPLAEEFYRLAFVAFFIFLASFFSLRVFVGFFFASFFTSFDLAIGAPPFD
jgi:hypothetical protein